MLYNKKYEREFADLMISYGHHCERVAGSGSAKEAVCDCVLIKEEKTFLVEVKATKEPVFYVRTHIKEQIERMRQTAIKQRVHALLAVKFKHRGWKHHDVTEKIPEVIKWH